MKIKRNKKIITLIACFMALCSVFTSVSLNVFAEEIVASGTCGDNLAWVLDSTGTLTISGTGEMYNFDSSNKAPWMDYYENICTVIIENRAESIGKYAFSGCSNLSSITIPESVKTIGENAFEYCTSLTSITIPEGVTSVSNYAFSGCSSLTNVTIPNGVTTIDARAFLRCSGLNKIVIPDTVEHIGNKAFYYCTNLNEVYFSENSKLDTIDYGAFYGCTNLANITIPVNVETIDNNAFYNVKAIQCNANIKGSPWGALAVNPYIDNNLVYYDSKETVLLGCLSSVEGDIEVPDTVDYVGANAFSGCENITKISFDSKNIVFSQDMLAEIGESSMLETIESPNTTDDGITYTYNPDLQDAPQPELAQNSNLPVLTKKMPNLKSSSDVSFINYKDGNAILFCNRDRKKDYTVPGGIIAICPNAFANCNIDVIIPNDVTLRRIGENAFLNSRQYNSWDKKDVFIIGNYVIQASNEIESFPIEGINNNFICIADSAFKSCNKLTRIVFPESLKFIGNSAFEGCIKLNDVKFTPDKENSTVEYIGRGAFNSTKIGENNIKIAEIIAAKFTGSVVEICSHKDKTGRDKTGTITSAEPTCTNVGFTVSKCTICDEEIWTTKAANGHNFSEWVTVFSSCTGSEQKKTCEACGLVENNQINEDNHDWKDDYTVDKKPSCEIDGSKSIHCKKCDIVKNSESIPANGHKNGKVKKLLVNEEIKTENTVNTLYKTYDNITYCAECNAEIKRDTEEEHTIVKATILNKGKYSKPLPYKSTITLHSDIEGLSCKEIRWFVNNAEVKNDKNYIVTDNSLTIKEAAKKEYSVYYKVTYFSDKCVTSDKETIKINTGFFARIIAFFQGIFGKLPVYDQK